MRFTVTPAETNTQCTSSLSLDSDKSHTRLYCDLPANHCLDDGMSSHMWSLDDPTVVIRWEA